MQEYIKLFIDKMVLNQELADLEMQKMDRELKGLPTCYLDMEITMVVDEINIIKLKMDSLC